MPLLIVFAGLILLLLFILIFKLNAFLSFVISSLVVGLAEGMTFAIGSGSLMTSHINDGGFWLVKEYFDLSIKDTLRTWTVMETCIGVTGLAGVLILNTVIS